MTSCLGPYQLELPLGAGGTGTVYRAVHRDLAQPRALKVLATNSAADPAFVERFRREARLAAGLHHPNIVKVYHFGEQGGLYYVAMELLPGRSLHQILRASGPLSADRALGLLEQLAAALDYVHARGVVHRDVKPANVIVDGDDHLTPVDFGISRAVDGTRLTRTGLIVGTPAYMAPEQVAAGQEGPDADRYALGVVAYEMLTGRVPFESPNTPALLCALVHTRPPAPRSFRAELPPALEGPLLRQLAKEPAARHPSAASFVAALPTAREAGTPFATTPTTRLSPGPSDAPTAGLTRRTEAAADTQAAPSAATRPSLFLASRRVLVGLAAVAVFGAIVGTLSWRAAGPASRPSAPAPGPTAAVVGTQSDRPAPAATARLSLPRIRRRPRQLGPRPPWRMPRRPSWRPAPRPPSLSRTSWPATGRRSRAAGRTRTPRSRRSRPSAASTASTAPARHVGIWTSGSSRRASVWPPSEPVRKRTLP